MVFDYSLILNSFYTIVVSNEKDILINFNVLFQIRPESKSEFTLFWGEAAPLVTSAVYT